MTSRISAQLSRRDMVRATVFLGAAAVTRPALAVDAQGLHFLVLGDWGRGGDFHQRDVAVQMGKTAERFNSQFIVAVGDNFYDEGVASVSDPQWRTAFEDVYTAPSLHRPWKVILGNHDYQGSTEAQLAYHQISDRWHMPARYWTEKLALPGGGTAEFFFTDTSPFLDRYQDGKKVKVLGQDSKAQLAWLEAALAKSTADWKIVYGHHPLFTDSKLGSGEGGRDIPEMITGFKPLLDRYGVQAYFNGHDHNMQHLEVDKISYVISGAGSKTNPVAPTGRCRFATDHSGFVAARLSKDVLDLQFVDFEGKVLGATTVSRTKA
jgi:tartrate-resistant acid phosphatase type 5